MVGCFGEAKGNATKAARFAGYTGNDTTLASVGAENLRKPNIRSEITRRRQELIDQADTLTPERIMSL